MIVVEDPSDDLRERDLRLHRRLERLSATKRPSTEPLSARDLGFVLHDVLVDGFRENREMRARNDQYWERVSAELEGVVTSGEFDRQLFLLGAYATSAGLGYALEEPQRSEVFEEFRGAAGGVFRFRRSRPGRWLVDLAITRYRTAEAPEGGSYLHVASVFVEECASRAAAPDAVAALAPLLGEVALDAFYDAAAGTISAASGWTIVT